MVAYACRIIEENLNAIASEHPKFNLEETRQWMRDHDAGYFIRDEESPSFDCTYMDLVVFREIYIFDARSSGPSDLFRRITKV